MIKKHKEQFKIKIFRRICTDGGVGVSTAQTSYGHHSKKERTEAISELLEKQLIKQEVRTNPKTGRRIIYFVPTKKGMKKFETFNDL